MQAKILLFVLISYVLMFSIASAFFIADRPEQEKIASLALSRLSVSEVSHLGNFSRISIT